MQLPKQDNSMDKSIVWAGFTVDDNNYDQSITQHFLSIFKICHDQVSLLEEIYTHSREKDRQIERTQELRLHRVHCGRHCQFYVL